ncbi:MAG: plasma-membrane proton-efflux P-type ATPase [Gammaproteobacteria bacterium GWE2_37_16]|nr:MAG: plasma-membrane proton-efflux P-type ATPase [Gammaproteobacteria bacterium GWE2_37_16]
MQKRNGLTTDEAKELLQKYGQNFVAEKKPNQWLNFLAKFWSPISWMLEATIILQLTIGKVHEALIIAFLLIFNSLLSFFQEDRANKALVLLRQHLAIKARVFRDNIWQLIAAEELVPGDIIHLRMGDIAPADIKILEGEALLDQSALTGEALPIESSIDAIVYSGALVKRGEATGEVTATGKNTYFGKTVELVQTAENKSHIKNIIFTIVKYLVAIDGVLAALVFAYAFFVNLPIVDVIPFVLILLVAAIPVALPATFTLATALGARQLAKLGVLVTRLSAIEEAAVMDNVCLDKTGTITRNKLELADLRSYQPYSNEDLLQFAILASNEATQDPIDLAFFVAANSRGLLASLPEKLTFTPFDPTQKCTKATFKKDNKIFHVIKGAPETVANTLPKSSNLTQDAEQMAAHGYRVLAVAIGKEQQNSQIQYELVGILALYDPPRTDSKEMIQNLKDLGLQIQMVTGDGLVTAQAVAEQVGIGKRVCHQNMLQQKIITTSEKVYACDVFAGFFPEDKFNLVQALQGEGHVTGMTGDGVNDAPALKQAEVGIAVANATDVAKAAASLVLTNKGLSGIRAAVEISRSIHKRMLTYILNKILKSFEIAIFLSLGVIFTKTLVITPLLMVLLLFANDFMTMSIATDNVPFSPKPESWRIPNLMLGSGVLAVLMLLLAFAVFFFSRNFLHLPLDQLQTITFLLLVFTGQGNIYLVRERKHIWHSMPGKWLLFSSLMDILIVSVLATQGILMTAISSLFVAALFSLVVFYLVIIDFIKVPVFRRFGII